MIPPPIPTKTLLIVVFVIIVVFVALARVLVALVAGADALSLAAIRAALAGVLVALVAGALAGVLVAIIAALAVVQTIAALIADGAVPAGNPLATIAAACTALVEALNVARVLMATAVAIVAITCCAPVSTLSAVHPAELAVITIIPDFTLTVTGITAIGPAPCMCVVHGQHGEDHDQSHEQGKCSLLEICHFSFLLYIRKNGSWRPGWPGDLTVGPHSFASRSFNRFAVSVSHLDCVHRGKSAFQNSQSLTLQT